MTETLRIIAWLSVTVIAGWGALSAILRKEMPPFFSERLALSYGLGLGIVTIEMAMLSFFRIKYSVFSITVWLVPFFLAAVFVRPGKKSAVLPPNTGENPAPFSLLEKLFMLFILSQSAYALFTALIKPLEAYDAVAIYAIKSKIFYLSKCVPPDFFRNFGSFVPHIEYPLLVPLAETFFYTFYGSLNDLIVKIIFPFYYIALLALFYCVSRRWAGRKTSLFFTSMLSSVPFLMEHAASGYADLSLAFYQAASFFYLLLWIREKKGGYLALSFVLSSLAVWTKTEGLMLAAVNMATVAIFILWDGRAVFGKGAAYIAVSSVSMALYMHARAALGLRLHGDFGAIRPFDIFAAAGPVKYAPSIFFQYIRQFFLFKKWNIVWVLILVLLILNFRKTFSKDLRYLTIALFLILAGYTIILLYMPAENIAFALRLTLDRFFLQFLPIGLLWTVIAFKEYGAEI